MKILYVKNNSERAKEFQLKTIIYEEDGKKHVKKQALCKEAIPHLNKMKDSYDKLTASIINPKIKLAKIIDETEDSLTFEFIDGISLEKRFNDASKLGGEESKKIINEYIELLKTGFRTTVFDSTTMVTDEYKKIFGSSDYNELDGELCFDGISNLDLIFSNIIYKNDNIYLIDYEWSYLVNVPVNYILYRPLSMMALNSNDFLDYFSINSSTYHRMERYFVDKYVMHNGFYFLKNTYLKTNSLITVQIEQLKLHVQELSSRVVFLEQIAQSLRIKNRVKRVIKKIIPSKAWRALIYIKHNPNAIKLGLYALKTQGFSGLLQKIKKIDQLSEMRIISAYEYIKPELTQNVIVEINNFQYSPLISIIIPVYNVDTKWLDLAIKSIEAQWYDNWELCLADDKSSNADIIEYLKNLNSPKIKVMFLEENLNISEASNAALSMARGEYIALMDNDDEITSDALYEVVKTINETKAEFIYSDEDKLEMDGCFSDPNFKPDFSPDMFLSQNYMSHLGVIKKELIDKVEGFTVGMEGAQDYDLYLKVLEHTDKIYHIQKVLYHWRKVSGSTATEFSDKSYAQDAGVNAIQSAIKRRNIDAQVLNGKYPGTYRVKYTLQGEPLVSIVIPFKDKPDLLANCVESVLGKSTYKNFEVIGISNNSEEKEIFMEMQRLESLDSRIKFYEYNVPFNYSDINNYAVNTYAKGEHIILLNNDIEIITPEWIESMLEFSQRTDIGAVGAKLYFPNNTIQHAGVIIGVRGLAGHSHKYFDRGSAGYFSRLNLIQNLSGVTAACLMIKKSIFEELEGLNEKELIIAFNDVDFCLRVREKGYLNIYTPYCEAYHHESISRGYEDTPDKLARFKGEVTYIKNRHHEILKNGDPFYNPNLTLGREDFSLR